MPVSIWLGMEDCLADIVESAPASVLDAGIGFGLWGCLLRQYLDVWPGRIRPEQWRVRIDGIEIDASRVQPHARQLYTEILIGDIRQVVPIRAAEVGYDVILFGDVIEHLPKADGRVLLEEAVRLAGSLVVARIPLGDGWRREGREEPDHHRSQWYADDLAGQEFASRTATLRTYDYHGNPYGLITIPGAGGSPQPIEPSLISELELRLGRLEQRLAALVSS
jgi:hypothetical protein